MIKLKICDVSPNGGCAYYRSLGPLYKLPKIMDISVEYLQGVGWQTLADTDILFLERPQDPNYLDAIEIAKEMGVKVWIDYDDLLHEIPMYNPGFPYFKSEQTQNVIEKSLSLADIVTVTSPAIKEYHSKFNQNIIIVENAWNDYNYPWIMKENQDKFISWRGSNTHRGDLETVKSDILNIASRYQDWKWSFVGDGIWETTSGIKECFTMQEVDIVKYHKFMRQNQFSIQIVPLAFNLFNEGKSNIGWIEGTYGGGATLAPDLPEFQRPGVVTYTEGKFGYYLEKLIKSADFRKQKYIESYKYISENLMLSKINHKRKEIIEGLLS